MHHLMKRRRVIAAGTATSVVALAVAALGGSAPASTGKAAASKCQFGRTIQVYVQAQLTGAASGNGQSVKQTLAGLIADQNRKGGLLGCKVAVTYGDNASSLTTDLPLMQKNLAKRRYDFVYATGFGIPAAVPYMASQKVFGVASNGSPSLSTGANTKPYLFDTTISNQQRNAIPGLYLGQATKYKRAAAIVDNTATGLNVGNAFTRAFQNHGGKVVHVERAPATLTDWTPVISRVRAAKPDVLFYNLFTPGAGTLLKAVRATGWDVPIVTGGTTGATNLAVLGNFGSALRKIPTVIPTTAIQGNARGEALVRKIKAVGGKIDQPLWLYEQPNDGWAFFVAAVQATKSLSPAKLASWLERNGNTRIPGLVQSTTTGFTKTRHLMQAKPGDFSMVPLGTLKNGMLKGPALSMKAR